LKEMKYEASLRKLEHDDWKRNHRYSLWQHDSDVFSIVSESTFMQKVNYIHQIPCERGWWSERRIIAGPALAFGANARVKMNP
jgi:hypothetical protein